MTTVATGRRGNETIEPKLLTIGAVCEGLREEFSDISVSKIRYLEDQGLITPRRTRGGYRLFSEEDVERLVTILRLQRDEFLPLRVIRQELDGPGAAADRSRRRNVGLTGVEGEIDGAELCDRASISPDFLRALEEFAVVVSRTEAGERLYRESEADIAAASARLARFGIDARHLRAFLTGAARQASLVEQLVAPGLRSRNPERRKGAFEDLEALAGVAQELSQLVFLRDLRSVVERTS
jgi:DNA-binding transcriptional MerR regulator